ncbi:MAG: WG repeat-containing protein [Bacteroidota bacterium]
MRTLILHIPFFVLIFLALGNECKGQKEVNTTSLYIPYNEYGEWGWCDTLGNIIIEPRYKSAGFFHKKSGRLIAKVQTEFGKNFVDSEGALVITKKLKIVDQLQERKDYKEVRDYYVLENKKGRQGLYDFTSNSIVVPVKYDSIYTIYFYDGNRTVFAKGRSKFLSKFELDDLRLVKTDIINMNIISDYNDNGSIVIAIEKSNNKMEITKNGKDINEKEYTKIIERNKDWTPNGSEDWIITAIPDEEIIDERKVYGRSDISGLGSDGIVKTFHYDTRRRYATTAAKYGFRKLHIIRKNNKLGVFNEKDEVILPIEYDRLEFIEERTQIKLYKQDKIGLKILFTHHPKIEARYDEISLSTYLRTYRDWTFAIFKVKIGDNHGYIGENGIEYFSF